MASVVAAVPALSLQCWENTSDNIGMAHGAIRLKF